jgi:hypothetical protein
MDDAIGIVASLPKLRAVYERFGFVHHSDRQVGPYFVSRYEYRVTGLESSRFPHAESFGTIVD